MILRRVVSRQLSVVSCSAGKEVRSQESVVSRQAQKHPREASAFLLAIRFSLLAFLSLSIGCSSNSGKSAASTQPAPPVKGKIGDINRWMQELVLDVPPATYRVQAPDSIRVTASAIKELDKLQSRIRPDGKVTLNLVGDVYVAGMTPAEIAEDLSRRLEKFYNKESIVISVEVTEFKSKHYYVFGQVVSPGPKAFTGSDTLIKVVAEAMLNDDAWPEKVVLIRPNEDRNVRQKITIDVKQMYETGKADQNYMLEEGDLVYVPPSPLAEFRMKTERLLAPIIPATNLAIMGLTGF